MPRLLTAGESHGPALVVIVDGFPAGIPLRQEDIGRELARRQAGYGRGPRASGTADRAVLVAGVARGRTTGAPIAIEIANPEPGSAGLTGSAGPSRPAGPALSPGQSARPPVPRPGHADLAAAIKYGTADFWSCAERASARETAARTAGATVAKLLLVELGVTTGCHVTGVAEVASPHREEGRSARLDPAGWTEVLTAAEADPMRCADPEASGRMRAAVDRAASAGDTVGGTFEVVALGCPGGLGGFAQWDRRLDARLAAAVMSVPGVRAVAIGAGLQAAGLPGSVAHDPIIPGAGPFGAGRPANRAGGLEGGMTNGQPVVVAAAMKPIPSLGSPLPSIDLTSGKIHPAPRVRGDTCAVPAAAVTAEAMVAWELAGAALERFGGDTLADFLWAAGREAGREAARR